MKVICSFHNLYIYPTIICYSPSYSFTSVGSGMEFFRNTWYTSPLIIDHKAGEIIRLVVSIHLSVRSSVSALTVEPFDL